MTHALGRGMMRETSPIGERRGPHAGGDGRCVYTGPMRTRIPPCHAAQAELRGSLLPIVTKGWSEGAGEPRRKPIFTICINDIGRVKSGHGSKRPVQTAPWGDCVKHCLARLAVVSLAVRRRRASAVAQFARTIEIRRLRGSDGSSFTSNSVSATPSMRRKLSSGMPSFISV